jgi:predicted nucleotidyltransferase
MEYTKNKIPDDIQNIINKFKKYIDTNIYYYGSIQRDDYFINKSDIDILIFTDNTEEMIHKVSHYFHINKKKIRKVVWNFKNKLIQAYKVTYYSNNPSFRLEIVISDEKYKKNILDYQRMPIFNMTFCISFLLIFLKYLYYNLQILPMSHYKYYKNFIFSHIRGEDSLFTYIE